MIFKNKILATILSFVAVANLYAQEDKTNDKIKFATGSWNEILVQAKAENKPIFVDFYTEWCGPCKMMSKQVFTDKEVAKYYNTNFISVKINAETQEAELVGKSGITAYPSLFYFNADGQVINKQVGALNAKQFVKFGEGVIDMLGIAKKLPEIKAAYEKNPKNLEATATYIKALTLANKTVIADSIATIYLPAIAEKDIEKPENWEIVSRYVKNYDSREFQYVMNNAKKFLGMYGEEAYANFFYDAMNTNLEKAIKSQKFENLAPTKKYYLQFNKQMGSEFSDDYFNLAIDMFYYQAVGNKEKYLETMISQTDGYLLENADELTKRVFEIIQKYDDKATMEKAATWSQKLLKKDNSALSNYVHAAVLFKQGNKVEAKKYLDIAATKNENPELDQYIEALKQELSK